MGAARARQGGFSPIEILLAAALFSFLVTAVMGAVIYGRSSTANAGERARATQLAEEGLEAVRNIRDAAFINLPDDTFGLKQSSGVWTPCVAPDACAEQDVTGIFTRQITISSVGGDRKTVTSTVTWQQGNSTAQVSVSSRLTNWLAALTPPAPAQGPIMMAYSKTTTTPFYRIWDGSNWGAEGSAQSGTGNINYVVLKSAGKRNEAILATQTSTGAIYIQIWNGTSWGNLTQVGTGSTTMRSFDIAYEKNSDHAIIAYAPTAASTDFAYRTWDGTTLSAATTITTPPTTGVTNWIEMRQNPLSTSDEIAMIMLDANADVYGMRWTGSAWHDMGTSAVWDATAAIATKKTIDVEYEQTSGKALFMWGDSVQDNQMYRTWNGTTLSSLSTLTVTAQAGLTEWVQLAARPNSNEIMLGTQDTAADLFTSLWSGSSWTSHAVHDSQVENTTSRNFDIVWETHSSNSGVAWLMWGDQATVTQKRWAANAWVGAGTVLAGSDDTSFIRLRADPTSGAVFAGIYEDSSSATDDIWESRLTAGTSTWSGKNSIWAGPTGATPVYFRIDIATP